MAFIFPETSSKNPKCYWDKCEIRKYDNKPFARVRVRDLTKYPYIVWTCELHAVAWFHMEGTYPEWDGDSVYRQYNSCIDSYEWQYSYTNDLKRNTILDILCGINEDSGNDFYHASYRITDYSALAKIDPASEEFQKTYEGLKSSDQMLGRISTYYTPKKENNHYKIWLEVMEKFSNHIGTKK